jgi:hypothetical protein
LGLRSHPREAHGFDKLSPNGMGFVFGSFVFPIVLRPSKGQINPNVVFCLRA